ncbi:hypothetical protein PT974_01964 [Cladobotryum mycophilum]|uniref:CFEM domain-containing protein n=1 Tax=Cladobotryum mycophilum TaxID=491253 RepID=A0ABR0SWU1_9HYPO
MKFTLAIAALGAAVVSASGIPRCALACLSDALVKNNCENIDFVCGCQKFNHIQNNATPCILKECGMSDAIQKVLPAVKAVCDKIKKEHGEGDKGDKDDKDDKDGKDGKAFTA